MYSLWRKTALVIINQVTILRLKNQSLLKCMAFPWSLMAQPADAWFCIFLYCFYFLAFLAIVFRQLQRIAADRQWRWGFIESRNHPGGWRRRWKSSPGFQCQIVIILIPPFRRPLKYLYVNFSGEIVFLSFFYYCFFFSFVLFTNILFRHKYKYIQ